MRRLGRVDEDPAGEKNKWNVDFEIENGGFFVVLPPLFESHAILPL
jgi:hypothetical protein